MKDWLVQAAMAKASGANVHNVGSLCMSYVALCDRHRRLPDGETQQQIEHMESSLQGFIRTGILLWGVETIGPYYPDTHPRSGY